MTKQRLQYAFMQPTPLRMVPVFPVSSPLKRCEPLKEKVVYAPNLLHEDKPYVYIIYRYVYAHGIGTIEEQCMPV